MTEALANAQRPLILLGGGGLAVPGVHGAALAIAKAANVVRDDWHGFGVVHMAASRMGGLMLGYAQSGGIADIIAAKPKLAFFLGADEVDFSAFADSLKVFVGHHGDKGAQAADVARAVEAGSRLGGEGVGHEALGGEVGLVEISSSHPGASESKLTKKIKPDFKKLGARMGKLMKSVAAAVSLALREGLV